MKTLQGQNFYAAYMPGVVTPYVFSGTNIIRVVITKSKYMKQILTSLLSVKSLIAIDTNWIPHFGGLILWPRKQYLTLA